MTLKKTFTPLKLYLLSLTILLAIHNVYGGEYDKVIIPVKYEMLDDSTIRREVHFIISGDLSDSLNSYKAKNYKNCIVNKYRPNGWEFYTVFNDTGIRCKKDRCALYRSPGQDIIKSVSFFHVKYGLIFIPPSFAALNAEIFKNFGAQAICTVSAYSSKDRWRHYLRLDFESGERKTMFLIIIKNSNFYQCVVSE